MTVMAVRRCPVLSNHQRADESFEANLLDERAVRPCGQAGTEYAT